jgi:hypothetical protein
MKWYRCGGGGFLFTIVYNWTTDVLIICVIVRTWQCYNWKLNAAIEKQLSSGLSPSCWMKYIKIYKYPDDGQSPEDNQFSMLYTVVRAFWNLFECCKLQSVGDRLAFVYICSYVEALGGFFFALGPRIWHAQRYLVSVTSKRELLCPWLQWLKRCCQNAGMFESSLDRRSNFM